MQHIAVLSFINIVFKKAISYNGKTTYVVVATFAVVIIVDVVAASASAATASDEIDSKGVHCID